MNTTIAGIEQADALLIIGSDVRHEAPLVNTRIRKSWIYSNLDVGMISEPYDLTYEYNHIGVSASDLEAFLKSTKGFTRKLKSAKKPMILVGMGALTRKDGAQILRLCGKIAQKYNMVREGWNGFNVLQNAASRTAGLDMGFLPADGGLDLAGIFEILSRRRN